MARQQRGVVDDGAVLRLIDDLHGNELRAERQDVELSSSPRVLVHHLGDGLALHAPAGEFEDRNTILLRFGCWGTGELLLKVCMESFTAPTASW